MAENSSRLSQGGNPAQLVHELVSIVRSAAGKTGTLSTAVALSGRARSRSPAPARVLAHHQQRHPAVQETYPPSTRTAGRPPVPLREQDPEGAARRTSCEGGADAGPSASGASPSASGASPATGDAGTGANGVDPSASGAGTATGDAGTATTAAVTGGRAGSRSPRGAGARPGARRGDRRRALNAGRRRADPPAHKADPLAARPIHSDRARQPGRHHQPEPDAAGEPEATGAPNATTASRT